MHLLCDEVPPGKHSMQPSISPEKQFRRVQNELLEEFPLMARYDSVAIARLVGPIV